MRAQIAVTLKPGVLDPQGKAIEGALRALSIPGIKAVRQGKVFDIEICAEDKDDARRTLTLACEKLLANTIVEDFAIEIA